VFDLDLHNKRKYIYQKKNKRKYYPFFFWYKENIILHPNNYTHTPTNN
jgi:hypothetical protein